MGRIYICVLVTVLSISCSSKKKSEVDKLVSEGVKRLEKMDFAIALEEFKRAKEIDPENCKASLGVIIAETMSIVSYISSLVGTVIGAMEAGDISESITQIIPGTFSPKGYINDAVNEFLEPIFDAAKDISDSSEIVIEKKCSLVAEVPIKIGYGDEIFAYFVIRGEWDKDEASLLGGISNFLLALIVGIITLNLEFDIQGFINAYLEGAIQFSFEDIVGTFRDLGLLADLSPDFLKANPEMGDQIPEVLKRISKAFNKFTIFFHGLFGEQDKNPYDDVIAYVDKTGDGVTGDDDIFINVYDRKTGDRGIYINFGDNTINIIAIIQPILRLLLSKELIDSTVEFFNLWSDAFNIDKDVPPEDEWIYIADINVITLSLLDIPDTIRFNPRRLSSKVMASGGIRELLPYWFDLDGDGYGEFIIEGEAARDYPLTLTESEYVTIGDSEHFPESILFRGELKELGTERDCISPNLGSKIPFIYIAVQNPSFFGSLEINLDEISKNCPNDKEWQGWKEPDLYAFNKAITDLLSKTILPLIRMIKSVL